MIRSYIVFGIVFFLSAFHIRAQDSAKMAEVRWVDSIFNSLSRDQKITQLMVIRASAPGKNGMAAYYDKEVSEAIRKYNIGAICWFQGGPIKMARLTNYFQSIAQTPLLITIDAENGLGMRLDSVMPLPRQMMLGSVQDPSLIYQYGRVVGEQCKRMGIQVNYAPVVDVNNNPANPVINDRSFGEDKFRVAAYGLQYMKGMMDVGVMACAKHFPGHGDVSVDSHKDLPVILKTREQLDTLELYPFKVLINAGIPSVMVAHLSIPAIDKEEHRPTSISYNNVTGLLRHDLNFSGLIFTDALEMQGVAKYFPSGEASVQAILAGNDMLCLPGDIPGSIAKIKKAIRDKKLRWADIDAHVKRVLRAKYRYGLASWKPVELNHLTRDLNARSATLRRAIAEQALTLLKNDDPALFPLAPRKRIAYVGLGIDKDNAFARQVRSDYDADVFYFPYTMPVEKIDPLLSFMKDQFDVVIIGLHNYARFPANHFGVSDVSMELVRRLQQQHKTITLAFGNPYLVKDICDTRVLIACYDDDPITQQAAADLLYGRFIAKGRLPVTACEQFVLGSGIVLDHLLPSINPADLGFDESRFGKLDSIVEDAIEKKAIPGGVLLVAKDGKIAYQRAYGYLTYRDEQPVYPETIYDLASVTKIMATTVSVMKLYDEGKIDLDKTLGDYLPWVRGSDKESLKLRDIILHQAGLKAWIPFYKETVDTLHDNAPLTEYFAYRPDSVFNVRVAEAMYMRHDWVDTMYKRILESPLGTTGQYVYSDNDFIFLGKIVESLTGMPLNQYVQQTFYKPLGMDHTGFRPRERFPLNAIAPTEEEAGFREQLIHGDVHDPGSAMFGGVAGHAGLFSDAYDLAVLAQVFLNGGDENGIHFFSKKTIDYFTAYQSDSRRGLGFDKPERDNSARNEPYPALSASPLTFGHTGFTGTCVWVDPAVNLTFIFLSNRVQNNGDANRFLRMNVRGKLLETVYEAMKK